MADTSSPLSRLPMLASLLDPQGQPNVPLDTLKRRRALADQLSLSASSPRASSNNLFGAIAQGLDGFSAGRMEAQADADEKAGRADLASILARVPRAGGGATVGSSSAIPTFATRQAQSLAGITPAEDLAVRTVIGEARGEGAVGQAAVAGVIRNRAAGSGQDFGQVVLAKNQFEPWGSRRQELLGYDPNSPAYQQAAAAALPVLRGEAPDPTGGATHFYAPKAQAAMGRSAPRWDNGTGRDLGNHRFFDLGYGGGGRDGIQRRAEADLPAQGAMPVADEGTGQPGFEIPGQPDATPLPVGAPIPPQMQPQQAPPDMAALFDRQPMAPAQSFSQDTTLPEIEATGARNVPLPPERPSVAALLAAPAQAQPSPQAAAMPFDGVSQASATPRLLTASPDAPAAPPPAQRSGLAAILGGVQDGLDSVFGGEQTQERLRRQAMAEALGGGQSSGASPRSQQLAQVLMQPAGDASAMPASAVPQPTSYTGGSGQAPTPAPRQALVQALDPSVGSAESSARAPLPGASTQPSDEQDVYRRIATHPYASEALQRYALDRLNPKISIHDAGNSLIATDPQGNVVRTYAKSRDPMKVGPNEAVYDQGANRELYRNDRQELTPDQRNYAQAQQGGYGGSFNDFLQQRTQRQGQAVTVKDASGNERTLFYDPQSNQLRTPEQMGAPPAPAPTNPYTPGGKGMTEEQAKNAGYAGRMTTSHSTINELENVGTGAIEAGIARIPGGNVLLSTGKQRLVQSQSDFVNSLLRRESGAAINKDEFNRYAKQYFPKPGDGPEVIAAKRRSREDALEGVFTSAGPNYRVPKDYSRSAPRNAAGPKVGTVEDGHVYIGGDPASPSSWTRTR